MFLKYKTYKTHSIYYILITHTLEVIKNLVTRLDWKVLNCEIHDHASDIVHIQENLYRLTIILSGSFFSSTIER